MPQIASEYLKLNLSIIFNITVLVKHFTKFLVLGLLEMAGIFKESHFESLLVEIALSTKIYNWLKR